MMGASDGMIPAPIGCQIAKRTYGTFYGLMMRGEVTTERRGSRWFVSRDDCVRLASESRYEATSPRSGADDASAAGTS